MLENYSALPIIEVTLHIFLAPEIGADITGRKNTNHIYIYILEDSLFNTAYPQNKLQSRV